MKMFLRQLCAASALCCLLGAFSPGLRAAPFDKQFAYTQPDGATVQLHGKGDEFSARFETLDGYTVVFDQSLKAYCFARLGSDGRLVSTGAQAHQGNPAALGLAAGLRMSPEARKQMVLERYQRWEQGMQVQPRWSALKAAARAAANDPQFSPPPFTTTGIKVGLTLLVDFDDDPSTIPQADIVEYCNGVNYAGYGNNGSVMSYFYDNSNGTLTYSNVVTIYIRAPKPKSTYDDVGLDAGQQGNLLIKDALDTMKALPNYDTTILPLFDNLTVDGNNQVVACNVFFAGENSGVWSMGLWPHSWTLQIVGAQELSAGGKRIWKYQITDISTTLSIGTFCHENGHMLCGYPDIYDYDYDSAGGAGAFSLMGSGGHDKNPSQIDAYLKRASGWATVTELDSTTSLRAVLSSSGTNFNHFYRFQKPGVPTEYFLLENRQQAGRDASIPGAGVAVWHCDELGDRDNQNTGYNTTHANYELTLVQADNQWHLNRNVNQGDAQDLYYAGNQAAAYANEFSDKTTPSARWWDGSASGFIAGDFSANGTDMTCRIGMGAASLKIAYLSLTDRNGNGVIDYNECADLSLVLTNGSLVTATNVQVTLTTTTPGVYIAQRTSRYPDVPPASLATNLVPFRISTAPDFVCGTPIDLILNLKIGQELGTDSLTLPTGVPGVPVRFDGGAPVAIPDPGDAASPIVVSNFTSAVKKVTVSLYLTHTWDQDLELQLISPAGVTNSLSVNHGLNGDNYGAACSPDTLRTTFDDDAALAISVGQPPFIGSFQPDQPLSIFIGEAGTNVNGTWLLRAIDSFAFDAGIIQCWSLNLTPAQCIDGTGECPGSDLALGLTAAPEPIVIGNNLVYTLSITNFGPSSATNINVSHLLPAGSVFVSATASQGAASHAGGVVTCNLGRLNPGRSATVTVVALPTVPGVITSAATVSSEQVDFNTDNNNASVVSHVNPPTAELAVAISAAPTVGVLGSPLVYTVAVTNNGPSAATLVTVSNALPATATIVSAVLSQGFATTAANGLIYNFNTLAPGGHATATITVIPNVEGAIQTTASVSASANLFDPVLANNFASLVTAVGPAADLAVSLSDYPDPVVRSNLITYTAVVTNRGPSLATAVVLNHILAPSVAVVSSNATQGAITFQSNTLTVAIGDLPLGGSATLTVQARPTANGTVASSAAVSGSKPDPNGANNSVLVTTLVADPFVSIVRDAATLVTESFAPANGTIDIGETVTLNLRLRNAGNIDSQPVQALLLATNGVVPAEPNAPRSCGVIPAGFGNTNLNLFTFTATGTNGGAVTAVLQLQYGLVTTNVSFAFSLPNTRVFSSTNSIAIRDANSALPYPSTIVVSNLSGLLGKATVTLANMSHSFPQDIAALLVAPTNQNRTILMSGAGAPPLDNATVTFDDSASQPISDWSTPIFTAAYRPANYLPENSLPAPAPAGPYPAAMAAVNAVNPNGAWSLYVADQVAGDEGQIAGGWSLALTMVSPVNQVADVSVAASVSPAAGVAGASLTYTFVLANAGPATANSVVFTNLVPAGAALISATAPAGATLSTNGGQVVVGLASLPAGSNATVTVVLTPSTSAVGVLTSVATVAAPETDLNLVNNTATLSTPVNLPAADVAITRLSVTNDPALGTNLFLDILVTNLGPAVALDTVLTDALPGGLAFVSALPSAGTLAHNGNNVAWSLGALAAYSGASLRITAAPVATGAFTNTAVLATASGDPVATNNVSSVPVTVAPQITAAEAVLTAENLLPPNGAIDSGETVTVSLGLRNLGTFYASNLVAELETGPGVADVSGAQVYGPLLNDGATVARPFTFTASGPNGGTIVATLKLRDGATSIGTVSFVFNLPNRAVYANTASINIPAQGIATPYPSIITVGSLTGVVGKVTVTINSLTHSFPRDVNLLLVSPAGRSVVIMSHAGGGYALSGRTFTIDDSALAALPSGSQILATSYRPAAYGAPATFPVPAPVQAHASTLSALNGTDPNGDWKLFAYDDSTGDGGAIAAGWSLDISVLKVLRPVADMALGLTCVPASFYLGAPITNIITVTNLGAISVDGVTVTNILPAGAVFVSASLSQGAYTGSGSGPIVCQFGTLAAGASAAAAVVSTPSLGGTLLTTAQLVADAADLNTANNSAQATVLGFTPLPVTLTGAVVSNAFHLTIQGQPNFSYMIKVSTDLGSWQTIDVKTLSAGGSARFVDPTPTTNALRFYRAERVLP